MSSKHYDARENVINEFTLLDKIYSLIEKISINENKEDIGSRLIAYIQLKYYGSHANFSNINNDLLNINNDLLNKYISSIKDLINNFNCAKNDKDRFLDIINSINSRGGSKKPTTTLKKKSPSKKPTTTLKKKSPTKKPKTDPKKKLPAKKPKTAPKKRVVKK